MEKNNTCTLCGKPIDLEDFNPNRGIPQLMKEKDLCFQCAFWLKRLEYNKGLSRENKIFLITPDYSHWISQINGKIITVPDSFSGIYHTQVYPIYNIGVILPNTENHMVIRTNNLPHQGTIPEHLRESFKPNAIFLTPEQAKYLEDYRGNAYEYIKNLIDNFDKSK